MAAKDAFSQLRERLNANSEWVEGLPLGDLNDKQKSKVLARVFALDCLSKSEGHEYLDEDVFEEGFVDGADDCGIDVLMIEGGRVHIIQAKYKGSSQPNNDRSDVAEFLSVLHRITDKKIQKNAQLKDLLRYINWKSDKFYFWFVTNGKIEGNTLAATKSPLQIPDQLVSEGFLPKDQIVDVRFIDGANFLSMLRYQEGAKSTQNVFTIAPADSSEIIKVEEDKLNVYYLVVNATQLTSIANNKKIDLYQYNIRGSLGASGSTNKNIIGTAVDNPEKFIFFNNGVSSICELVEPDGRNLKVHGFSVINGAQTVRSLTLAADEPNYKVPPKVLLKITEIQNHNTRGRFLEDMVRYNNTQNKINTSDFRSNDPVQASYKEIIEKKVRLGNPIEYKPKRNEKAKRGSLVINMADFAKVIYAFYVSPYLSENGGNDSLYDEAAGKNYEKIFGRPSDIPNINVVEEQLSVYLIWCEFQKLLKDRKLQIKNSGETEAQKAEKLNAIDRGPVILHVANLVLDRPDMVDIRKKFFAQVNKDSGWKMGDGKNLSKFVGELFDISCAACITAFGIFSPSSVKVWQRGKDGIGEKLAKYIKEAPGLSSGLKNIL